MAIYGDHASILKRARALDASLWQGLEKIRPELAEIARALYPQAVTGLVRDSATIDGANVFEDDMGRITNVPLDAFRVAVSGFSSNLTPPSREWFTLKAPEFGQGSGEEYLVDYQQLARTTAWALNFSGAYRAVQTLYKHLVAFGFGCMLVFEDPRRVLDVECLRVGSYALGTGKDGRVCRVVRRYALTGAQFVGMFGEENTPPEAIRCAERGDENKRFEVRCMIEPHEILRSAHNPFTLDLGFAWRAVWWHCAATGGPEKDGLLAVRGFAHRPLVAPRLSFERGDIYGRGCGQDVAGLCRALEELTKAASDLVQQEAWPALLVPASMARDGLRLGPNDVNYYPDSLGAGAVGRAIQRTGDLGTVQFLAERMEREIRKALFNTEFETINAWEDGATGRMTATEVNQRVGEKMDQLFGIATTLNDELLDPLVIAAASIVKNATRTLADGGEEWLVDLSDAVRNADQPLDITYLSKLHQSMNAARLNAGMESISRAGGLAQFAPDVMDNFDADAYARDQHRMLGADEAWLRTRQQVAALREQRAQAQAQQEQAQMDAQQAKTLRDIASIPVNPASIGGEMANPPDAGGAEW